MERRGRIPVAKFRTQEGKTRSRSRVREPDYNEQDPETDLFTLLEDNIALKEENKALKVEIDEHKKIQNDFLEEKTKMHGELETLSKQQMAFEAELKEITTKYTKLTNERNALDKLHKMKVEKVNSLTNELQQLHLLQGQQETHVHAVIGSISLKSKLVKILPILSASNIGGGNNDMDSLIDVESSAAMPITGELMERLVDEFLALKNSMNSVELQLYEANEKIAELVENQHHLEEENETLRIENTNLTKVAKLLTENMKESVETSKKMETALIKLKQRNDELNAKARDLTDGQPAPSPSPTTIKANEEFEQIKEEIENQNRDHGERIVEMRTLMEAAIQKNTNDELKTLQLKLEILEDELRKANARAELAEGELAKYKRFPMPQTPPPLPPLSPRPLLPPPPPPPMPSTLLYKAPQPLRLAAAGGGGVAYNKSNISNVHNLHNKESGDVESDKIIETVKHQVQPEAATGVDALMRELKSGRVTLRRNRRKTKTNDALQEMFQVLEISQKQNRDSKICINMHL